MFPYEHRYSTGIKKVFCCKNCGAYWNRKIDAMKCCRDEQITASVDTVTDALDLFYICQKCGAGWEKKQDAWDDDEPELRLSDKPYPKDVWAAITQHIRKGRRGYEITNHSGIKAALAAIGWSTNL